uniref:ATP-binding protein n=1 Tax=Rhodococcus erythropolis TaxID=1833 RepID=UPI000BB39302|nr:ATP-binding protein [Rhodococcus erythropolis]
MATMLLQASDSLVGRLAHESDPIRAVIELVWNCLDAEAWSVNIELIRDEGFLDAVAGVKITDDGHGINPDQLESQFGRIGDSWKASAKTSLNDLRGLHGNRGEGRLRAFALGESVSWTSVAKRADQSFMHVRISSERANRTRFATEVSKSVGEDPGTVFEAVGAPQGSLRALANDSALAILRSHFAPILIAHDRLSITYNGHALDPHQEILADTQFDVQPIGMEGGITLRVIEWKPPAKGAKKHRAIYYGPDLEHFVYEEDGTSVESNAVFSAYVVWSDVAEHAHSIPLGDMAPEPLRTVWKAARKAIKEHFGQRKLTRRREQVIEWKEKGVYPYVGEPPTEAEAAERAVFDVVSGALGGHIARKPADARLTLALLREAVKSNPEKLTTVLHEVASLDSDDLTTLTRLLGETTLPEIIRSTNIIANRNKFLAGLDHLVFDPEESPTVGERDHLHKILNTELWIFGEQYNLMNSERGLTEMLRTHLKLAGLPTKRVEPVKRWDGKSGRVDLHLAAKSQEHDRIRHLIIELKAPRISIGRTELDQVEDYANAIVDDPRFHGNGTTWDIILVGTEIEPAAQRRVHEGHLPTGRVHHVDPSPAGAPEVNIFVRKWRDVIDENRRRLAYLTHVMHLDPGVEESLDYFREEYADVLPDSILIPSESDSVSA